MSSPFEDFFGEPAFDYVKNKKEFIDHMNYLKTQTVEESVFYKKYLEVQNYKDYINKSMEVKAKVWVPFDLNDEKGTIAQIEALEPRMRFIEQDEDRYAIDWLMLRVFCHTMNFDQSPGRFLRFIVEDSVTGKYLGAVSLGSDVISIEARDKYIQWTSDDKLKTGMLRNSAIGSCIMAAQPFGYNFLGGKMTAGLLTTKYVRDVWKRLYTDTLVGFTTTSLYGTNSMYNGLPWWHKCGATKGLIALKPDDNLYEVWHHYIQKERKEEYNKKMTQAEGVSGPVTAAKQRIIQMIFSELGLKNKEYVHTFERGVYYAGVYENFKEFLQTKITEKELVMKPKFASDVQGVMDWWKPKAIARYQNLKRDGRLKPELLYYNEIIGKKYSVAKKMYYDEVGR